MDPQEILDADLLAELRGELAYIADGIGVQHEFATAQAFRDHLEGVRDRAATVQRLITAAIGRIPAEPLTGRASLAAQATAIGRASSNGPGPTLTADSDAEAVAAWLQWCDPNGCHTADRAAVEDCDPYDLDGAWDALAAMIEDNR